MATLLMVESWLQSTGHSLPPLIRELGHDYVLMTRDPALYGAGHGASARRHPALHYADEVVVVETNETDTVVDRAAALSGRRPIHGVLTTCDYYLVSVARIAEHLGLPGPAPGVMAAATRKDSVRQALDLAGVPNPAHAVVKTWDEARAAAARIGYPLVAKPVDLNAGTSVRRVDSDAHLKDAVHEIAGRDCNTRGQAAPKVVLLEEMLVGTEVSVEAVTVDGRTTVLGITDKSVTAPPAFVESGHMFPARLEVGVADAVEAFVVEVLDAVGFIHGLTHSEVMVTADGSRLVELNPRQGGGHIFELVHLVTGTNPLQLLVDVALGRATQVGTTASPLEGAAAPGGSAAVVFVMAPHAGEVRDVAGLGALSRDPHVVRWTLPTPVVSPLPVDNEAYLGHVVTIDRHGRQARTWAEAGLGRLRLCFADGTEVAPLAVRAGGAASPATSPSPIRPTSASWDGTGC
jgi:biotin carboxylase